MNKKDSQNDLPKEYRQGYARFLGLKIDLTQKTFIPRPETEFWTAAAIKHLAGSGQKDLKILDLCCGSGCVGVAALKKLKTSCVRFVDIDGRASRQTKINVKLNGIDPRRTKITRSDLFDKLPADARYDAILANPPYIDKKRSAQVQLSVTKYEPAIALWGGGKNGLSAIKKIITGARHYLYGGLLYLEFDAAQRGDIEKMLSAAGYGEIEFASDKFARCRFVKAVFCNLDKKQKKA